ncbi:uncharacterized protein cd34 [Echeneis naucrates]|uniref:uncharacterized protein cd34 n=1 Tax=Echeneis naucrates TaxID=173247 RepID=UPI001113BE3C|nr:uncharacterized protein LOC115046321 [Echeneis naucrates]
MAASMWRMNGLWRRTAGVLVLCALLLSDTVTCQGEDEPLIVAPNPSDDPTVGPVPTGESVTPEAEAPSVDESTTANHAPDGQSSPSAAPGLLLTQGTTEIDDGTSGTPAVPAVDTVAEVAEVPDSSPNVVEIVPTVRCVEKEAMPQGSQDIAVRVVVTTHDCETTKRIILENAANWCHSEGCSLDIFQNGSSVMMAGKDIVSEGLNAALKSGQLKEQLGVTSVETPSEASSGSSVFAGILVTGLLAALAITIGYFKCQRRPDPKGVRLAEEAYPVDQDNQANTLVSVAPLNPPPETPEKPSVNGESTEAAKTPSPPPTNGHSTTKTADTEL